jgi:hypothetical protein
MKGVNIKFYERVCVSVFALLIRHASHVFFLRRVVFWACPALPCFSTLGNKRHVFSGGGGEITGHKVCVFIFCTTFVSNIFFLVLRRTAKYDQKCILVFM